MKAELRANRLSLGEKEVATSISKHQYYYLIRRGGGWGRGYFQPTPKT